MRVFSFQFLPRIKYVSSAAADLCLYTVCMSKISSLFSEYMIARYCSRLLCNVYKTFVVHSMVVSTVTRVSTGFSKGLFLSCCCYIKLKNKTNLTMLKFNNNIILLTKQSQN